MGIALWQCIIGPFSLLTYPLNMVFPHVFQCFSIARLVYRGILTSILGMIPMIIIDDYLVKQSYTSHFGTGICTFLDGDLGDGWFIVLSCFTIIIIIGVTLWYFNIAMENHNFQWIHPP